MITRAGTGEQKRAYETEKAADNAETFSPDPEVHAVSSVITSEIPKETDEAAELSPDFHDIYQTDDNIVDTDKWDRPFLSDDLIRRMADHRNYRSVVPVPT